MARVLYELQPWAKGPYSVENFRTLSIVIGINKMSAVHGESGAVLFLKEDAENICKELNDLT